MSTIRQLLASKNRTIQSTTPSTTVYEAIGQMVEHGVGSLVVMNGDDLVGIVTERDYLRKVALEGRSSKTTAVDQIMSRNVVYVAPDTSDEDCMALMTHKRIRHLPIMEEGKLMGVISIGDIVKHLAQARGAMIDELAMYIQNAPSAASTPPSTGAGSDSSDTSS